MKKRLTQKLRILLMLSVLAFVSCANGQETKKQPDILFIAIDDMNDWTTLFDEDNPIKTPNLERLAARGTFFTRAYCTTAACNPSRTAILSGFYPDKSKVYGNTDVWRELIPDVVTLPQYFTENGYATRGAGKIFHHGPQGWDREDNPSFEKFMKLKKHSGYTGVNHNGFKKAEGPVNRLSKPAFDWGVHDVDKQTDEYTVEYVNAIMENYDGDKPLFLAAGIFRPHLPFWAPSENFEKYPYDELEQPPMPVDDMKDIPKIGIEMSDKEYFIYDNVVGKDDDDPRSLKKLTQSYQAAADFSDEMLGRLLDQLDATGRADNTIIVLWADHGYHLGDKQSCVKFTLWEKANHVPFIIVAPGLTKPGTRCETPVSLIDIYPTLVDLAELPENEEVQGLSLRPLLEDPNAKWERPAIMTMGPNNYAIRTDRWRYISYSDGTEELYDHDNDPWELTNLAGDAKYKKVIKKHKKWVPNGNLDN